MDSSESEKILAILAEVSGLLEIEEFRAGILDALEAAVPSDWVSLNDIGPDPGDLAVIVRPELSAAQVSTFSELVGQNPLYARYLETHDARAYRFSDVVSRDELHALDLYRRFYGPLGIEYQIAFTLPAGPGRTLAIAMSRGSHDYTDAERDLLNAARPWLTQAYRNAVTYDRAVNPRSSGDEAAMRAALVAEGLSAREAEVVHLVATGLSNRDAGAVLGISGRTVGKHLERAYAKLGTAGRSDTAARAWALTRTRVPTNPG